MASDGGYGHRFVIEQTYPRVVELTMARRNFRLEFPMLHHPGDRIRNASATLIFESNQGAREASNKVIPCIGSVHCMEGGRCAV